MKTNLRSSIIIVIVVAVIAIIVAIYPTISRSRAIFLFSIATLASPFAPRIPRRHAAIADDRRCVGNRRRRRHFWYCRLHTRLMLQHITIFYNAFNCIQCAIDGVWCAVVVIAAVAVDYVLHLTVLIIMLCITVLIDQRTITDNCRCFRVYHNTIIIRFHNVYHGCRQCFVLCRSKPHARWFTLTQCVGCILSLLILFTDVCTCMLDYVLSVERVSTIKTLTTTFSHNLVTVVWNRLANGETFIGENLWCSIFYSCFFFLSYIAFNSDHSKTADGGWL